MSRLLRLCDRAASPCLTFLCPLVILAWGVFSCAVWAQEPRPADNRLATDLFDALYADVAQQLATHERGGRWRSTDSSFLAWSCGQQLSALVDLFEATGGRNWLDQLVRYADAMFANLTPNRDGFLSWRSGLYSRVRVRVRQAEDNTSAATVEPVELWLGQTQRWIREPIMHRLVGRKDPVDWQYHLIWQTRPKIEVKGAATGKVVDTIAVRPGQRFEPLPGVELTIQGQPAAGDTFALSVEEPRDFDSAVHDGVVLTPICRFIDLVRDDPALRAVYGEKADGYLKVIESDLIPKWNSCWRDWQDGGLLVAQVDDALSYPGISLPHNQYLALGNVLVWLHRITGKEIYRDKAEKMGRFFKSCLRLEGDHYEWNYWDATGQWDKPWDKPEEKRPEDTGHGSLDIGFVVDAVRDGIVFDENDLNRFANTLLKVMWNGSLTEPTVGGYVNTDKPTRQSVNLQDWVRLSRIEPEVLAVCTKIIQESGSLKAKAQLLRLLRKRAEKG